MTEEKRQKLIAAANSENGKLIIEYLTECLDELDCNNLSKMVETTPLGERVKAILEARDYVKSRISFLQGNNAETDTILNYLK